MGIQINGSTDRITAIDGTIDFVSNIGNIGLITASRYELQDSITIGAGSTIIKTVNGELGIGTATPSEKLTVHTASGNTKQVLSSHAGFSELDFVTASTLRADVFANASEFTFTTRTAIPITFRTNGTNERLRITSTGQILVGTTSDGGQYDGVTPHFVSEVSGNYQAYTLAVNANHAGQSAILQFVKSRGTSDGSNTIVQDGDRLGSIYGIGADGTDRSSAGAAIDFRVDGTPGANDMPGRIEFRTTADGAVVPTERLRITSSGVVSINDSTPETWATLQVNNHSTHNAAQVLIRGADQAQIILRDDTGGSNQKCTSIRNDQGVLIFGTHNDAFSAFTERYRITTAGTHVFGGNTAAPIVDNGELLYRGNSTSTFESLPQSFYVYGDSLGSNTANAGTGIVLGGNYKTDGSSTTFAGIHAIKENTTNDDYGGALVFGVRQNAASSWERLRIKSDGKISIDKGVTALLTPSQTTAATIGGGNMTGGSSWFNHTNTADYYGVDGDHKLTNGTTYGKITARNTDAAITNDATGGHVYFLIAKTVGGTLGNNNWKVENVAGWKMKWPSSLAAGATTTFYMRDAVESFGSPTVPDSGDYYIAWFFSTSQDMGTRGSSWFVDDASGGKIYYTNPSSDLSNPGQHIPSHNDSWDGTMTGEKIHFRYETLPVADLTGTVLKSPLLVDPIMQGTPTYDGHPMTGGSLVKWVEWDSNTASIEYSSASFTDSAYLIHYNLVGSPGWYQTRFQFMNADKTAFSDSDHYISHCDWLHAAATSSSLNSNVNGSCGIAGSIWLCGNGAQYGHAGWVWVIPSNIRHNFSSTLTNNWQDTSVGSDEINHFLVRGHSYLTIGNQASTSYREEGGGQTRFGGYNVSGFRIFGSNSSSNNGPDSQGSHNGWVSIYRYKRGV